MMRAVTQLGIARVRPEEQRLPGSLTPKVRKDRHSIAGLQGTEPEKRRELAAHVEVRAMTNFGIEMSSHTRENEFSRSRVAAGVRPGLEISKT